MLKLMMVLDHGQTGEAEGLLRVPERGRSSRTDPSWTGSMFSGRSWAIRRQRLCGLRWIGVERRIPSPAGIQREPVQSQREVKI